MSKVKLKTNIIIDGEQLNRGSIVDDESLPAHLKTDKYVSRDLDHKEGKVLLLMGISYTTDEVDPINGQRVRYPCTLAVGEVVRLEDIPERQREDWKEGVEYKREWTEKDRMQVRGKETERYMKQFEPDDAPLGIYDR